MTSFLGDLEPSRRINLPSTSRYLDTPLHQVVDDVAGGRGPSQLKRGLSQVVRGVTSPGRRALDRARNLPHGLQNQVRRKLNTFTWGVWRAPTIPFSSDDVLHTITQGDTGRLDQLANRFLGSPNYWWAIAQQNGIKDPLGGVVPGTKLRIPSLDSVLSTSLDAATQRIKPTVEGVVT